MQASSVNGTTVDGGSVARSTQAGFSAVSTSNVEIEVIRDACRFLSLRDEWDSLVEAAAVSIFQTFDWQWTWWKFFGKRLRLHILLFRQGGTLIGIAPLYVDVHSALGMKLYQQLRFMGGGVRDWRSQWNLAEYGPSDYLDVIALPGFESAVGDRFLAYLREETWLDEASLENIPENGVLMNAVVPQLRSRGWQFSILQDHVCPRITVPASLEEYTHTLRSSVRHRLSQARRAYTNEGLFELRSIESREKIEEAVDELVRLHQLRWNRLGYPGMFADNRFRVFLKEVAERFLEKGWLWFKTAQANGRCIAARLGFQFKGCLNDFIAGFDEKSPAAKRRPGIALLLSMIEDAIQRRLRTVNLIRGYETYKYEFTSEVTHNWKVVIPNVRSQRLLRARWHRLLDYLEFLFRKVYFEWTMFLVHYREHGFLVFLLRYTVFRTKKLLEKIVNVFKSVRRIQGFPS